MQENSIYLIHKAQLPWMGIGDLRKRETKQNDPKISTANFSSLSTDLMGTIGVIGVWKKFTKSHTLHWSWLQLHRSLPLIFFITYGC